MRGRTSSRGGQRRSEWARNTFLHIINGKLASVTVHDDASKRQAKGVIGVQIEGPRVVAFRNVWLKKM